jgi:hypothetical protein
MTRNICQHARLHKSKRAAFHALLKGSPQQPRYIRQQKPQAIRIHNSPEY